MTSEYNLNLTQEEIREIPMVDLAFLILKAANKPFYFRDLLVEIAKVKGISEENIKEVMAQIYTEINIDGRFACVGKNLWGLKRWYPVEKTEDPLGSTNRPRIINDDDDDEDLDEEVFEDDSYDEHYGDEDDETGYLDGDEDDEIDDEIIDDADLDDDVIGEDFPDDLADEIKDEVLGDDLETEDGEEDFDDDLFEEEDEDK